MADISADLVKTLREKTGAGIIDCKNALSQSSGDMDKAIENLRKKGLASAEKKAGRTASEGAVSSYIHAGGKIGVLIEVNCETDFVARTDEFQQFVRDVAMQVAAANPLFVRREEVPANLLESEKAIYRSQAENSGKPAAVLEKIAQGKLEKYFSEVCLIEQQFIKDPDKSVKDKLNEVIAKLGENITVRRFARFQLGEGVAKPAT